MLSKLALLLALVSARSVHAQKPGTPKHEAELLQLVVRPRVGDTLWLQLEQTIDTRSVLVTETSPGAPGAPRQPGRRGPEYGPVREPPTTGTIAMRLFAHSLVEASDLHVTSVVAITDSLTVRTGTAGQLGPPRAMALAPADRLVRVNVSPEGAMSVVGAHPASLPFDANFSGMPPMLPSRPVAVGEEWERDIPLPSLPIGGVRAEGLVHAEFRLDSVSHGGHLAYVSMTGTLRRQGAVRDLPPGTQVVTSGLLRGFLVLDRVRGWITDAETTIHVQSDVTPRPGDKAPARSLDIRLSQRMKVR